ncbi:MAG: hypothetical protein KKF68_00780 [Nanoarchaeota archaeon]|nr:hypothetical protein [Nanoarchaeota archaeon]
MNQTRTPIRVTQENLAGALNKVYSQAGFAEVYADGKLALERAYDNPELVDLGRKIVQAESDSILEQAEQLEQAKGTYRELSPIIKENAPHLTTQLNQLENLIREISKYGLSDSRETAFRKALANLNGEVAPALKKAYEVLATYGASC